MKKYRVIFILLLSVGLCAGCQQEISQKRNPVTTNVLSPTTYITNVPTITNCPTPTMTASERYDAEELEREKNKRSTYDNANAGTGTIRFV